jgi:hypothetical protein
MGRRRVDTAAVWVAFACLLAYGCDETCHSDVEAPGDTGVTDGYDSSTAEVTYHRDVRPLIDRACAKCHSEGGSSPFALTHWDEVRLRAFPIVDAVVTRKMPPAQADPSCREVVGGNWLTTDEVDLFVRWQEEGYPEGDPGDYVPSPVPASFMADLGPPDLIIRPAEPYTLDWDAQGEDYAWIPLDYVAPEDIFVVATRLVPSVLEIAHHGTIATLSPSTDWVAEDRMAGAALVVGGHVPGMAGFRVPAGTAFVLPEGTTFALDMHYHAGAMPAGALPTDVEPEVHMWLAPRESITHRARIRMFSVPDFVIEADDPEATVEGDFTMAESPSRVFAVVPHMHYLGSSLHLRVHQWDGTEACLLREPYYDFHWQVMQRFVDDAVLSLEGGESATLTCTYDNSAENQPYVNGQQLRSTDVSYGESSLEEMCMAWVFEAVPHP